MRIDRRRFLGFGAGALAGTVAGSVGGKFLGGLAAKIDTPRFPPRGKEESRLSICAACPGGCGVRVRCIGGRAVKVDGNPLHPVSRGRLCPKGQASLQALYHPDRLMRPLRRRGPRGALDSFQATSWDEALNEISMRLSLLRRQGRPEALALVRGAPRGVDAFLARRFLQSFGSPNDVLLPRGDEAALQALTLTQGLAVAPAYDLAASELVLSLGSSILESSGSPVHAMHGFGQMRRGEGGRRGKLIHVGSRLSMTGAAADEWIPVRPGTEGILALGLAAVLVAEELHDREFVLQRTRQFEDLHEAGGALHPGLRTLLEREFPLERVASETGVPVNRLLALAREFAAARPGIAIGPRAGPLLAGQLFDHLAAHVLNALVGNIDAPGGVLAPESINQPAGPPFADDAIALAGRSRPRVDGAGGEGARLLRSDPEALAEALLSQAPYKIEALIALDCDPAFASFAPDSFAAALESVPLVVSLTSLPNDTSLYSDWILPLAHSFECWNLDSSPSGVPFLSATLARPVCAPRGESRPAAEVLLDLARRIPGPVAESMPWKDLPTLIREQVDGLFELRRGASVGTEFDEAWVRLMERAGWWAPGYRSKDELWARVQESGGWWDPFYDHWHWTRVLETESKRFEFCPSELALLAQKRRSHAQVYVDDSLPSATVDGTLALQLFEPLPVSGGIGAELPALQEILDPGLEVRWETWVEIHPMTAHALGIVDRASVQVASSRASITARTRVTERVVPGVAAMPVGLGKRAGGRWAAGIGSNPLRLLAPAREPLSGLVDLGSTRVRVVPDVDGRAGAPVIRGV